MRSEIYGTTNLEIEHYICGTTSRASVIRGFKFIIFRANVLVSIDPWEFMDLEIPGIFTDSKRTIARSLDL